MNALEIVNELLEGVVVPAESLQQYAERLDRLAKGSVSIAAYVRKANRILSEIRAAYAEEQNAGGQYSSKDNWVWLSYPTSLKTAVSEFLDTAEHELVHRSQYKRAKRRKPFYKVSGYDANAQDYLGRPHEMMANAHAWVQAQIRKGLSKQEILSKLKQPKAQTARDYQAGSESPFKTWYAMRRAENPDLNRFFKYAYQYAQALSV